MSLQFSQRDEPSVGLCSALLQYSLVQKVLSIFYNFPTQNVAHRSAASAGHGSLLEKQNLKPHLRPPESESAFWQDPRGPTCSLKFEKSWSARLPSRVGTLVCSTRHTKVVTSCHRCPQRYEGYTRISRDQAKRKQSVVSRAPGNNYRSLNNK